MQRAPFGPHGRVRLSVILRRRLRESSVTGRRLGVALVHGSARADAEVVRELTETDYGSREFSVPDLEGTLWSFGTYNPHDR